MRVERLKVLKTALASLYIKIKIKYLQGNEESNKILLSHFVVFPTPLTLKSLLKYLILYKTFRPRRAEKMRTGEKKYKSFEVTIKCVLFDVE